MNGQNNPKINQLTGTTLLDPSGKAEAHRLLELYLETFREAPEAGRLLQKAFFSMFYDKTYLQDNVLLIPRRDYIWFFKYIVVASPLQRTLELKKRSTDIAETGVERVNIQTRVHYALPQTGDILYTKTLPDGAEMHVANTIDAVALAEKLLEDFLNDKFTR